MDLHVRIPGPLQYLIHEQAKSIVYLQDLQNEVGSLLEFRDLVLNTFPQLHSKSGGESASSSTASAISSGSPSSVRQTSTLKAQASEPPPGGGGRLVKVKSVFPGKKSALLNRSIGSGSPETSDELQAPSQTTWSNISSGRIRKAKCIHEGGGGGVGSGTVQDSGFSTETKEHHSSSTLLSPGSHKSVPSADERWNAWADAAKPDSSVGEDELWNLLDVIHRKGVRLRQELDHMQLQELSQKGTPRATLSLPPDGGMVRRRRRLPDVRDCVRRDRELRRKELEEDEKLVDSEPEDDDEIIHSLPVETVSPQLAQALADVDQLRKERHLLLERLNGLERMALLSQARTGELERRVRRVTEEKRALEAQLKTAVLLKAELNSKIHRLHTQFVRSVDRKNNQRATAAAAAAAASSTTASPNATATAEPPKRTRRSASQVPIPSSPATSAAPSPPARQRRLEKQRQLTTPSETPPPPLPPKSKAKKEPLGHLDCTVRVSDYVAPDEGRGLFRGVKPDRAKVAAVLRENNVVELRRQLLLLLATCETLRSEREEQGRASEEQRDASELQKREVDMQMASLKEANDQLHLRLQQQMLELEDTRTRLQLLENASSKPYRPVTTHTQTEGLGWTIHVPNLPARSASAAVKTAVTKSTGSQTESPSPQTKLIDGDCANNNTINMVPVVSTPTKRPSRIPLHAPPKTALPPHQKLTPATPNSPSKRSWRRDSLSRKDSSSSGSLSNNKKDGGGTNAATPFGGGSNNNSATTPTNNRKLHSRERLSSKDRSRVEPAKACTPLPAPTRTRQRHHTGQHNTTTSIPVAKPQSQPPPPSSDAPPASASVHHVKYPSEQHATVCTAHMESESSSASNSRSASNSSTPRHAKFTASPLRFVLEWDPYTYFRAGHHLPLASNDDDSYTAGLFDGSSTHSSYVEALVQKLPCLLPYVRAPVNPYDDDVQEVNISDSLEVMQREMTDVAVQHTSSSSKLKFNVS